MSIPFWTKVEYNFPVRACVRACVSVSVCVSVCVCARASLDGHRVKVSMTRTLTGNTMVKKNNHQLTMSLI